jgi:hypothetical protein
MNNAIRMLVMVPLVSALVMVVSTFGAQAGDDQVLVKAKFATPLNRDDIIGDWKTRGFEYDVRNSERPKGWSRTRTFKSSCVSTVLSGRVEYVIDGKTYSAGPGDEVYHPANTLHTVTNVYDGTSVVLSATK